MNMRKVFAGATMLSVTGAVLLGGVFAWQTDQKVAGDAEVGYQAFDVNFQNYDALLGPNGATSEVGSIEARNRGDFLIEITGGTVAIDQVTNWGIGGEPGPDNPACTTAHFSGSVVPDDSVGWDNLLPVGGDWNADHDVNLTVNWEAPNSCMGAQVFYTVTVTGENPASEAP